MTRSNPWVNARAAINGSSPQNAIFGFGLICENSPRVNIDPPETDLIKPQVAEEIFAVCVGISVFLNCSMFSSKDIPHW